ncbi:MAG: ABC transporter substrate-binding protein [Actinomycetota bacterium]|nr:ABC transporter substrate-binding protein [Actinomycetota bacterium]
MTRTRLLPIVALLAALALVTAACGQKANVHLASTGDDSTGGGEEVASEEGEEVAIGATTEDGEVIIGVDAEGNIITAPAGSEAAKKATSGGPTRRTTTTGGGGGSTATTAPRTTSNAATGKVWGDTVVIGIHAPITGAAPLPSSFQAAADFVKSYYNTKGNLPPGPNGKPRTLDIVILDDQYQPAVATSRCSELVKQRNAFLLIGAAGTDQIQACARYAATVGVPYLSAGVTEKGLTKLKNYFAISMTYKAQVPYLVKYVKERFPAATADESKMYMVYSDTPNFGDAVAAWRAALPNAKLIKLSRVPSQPELNAAAAKLCSEGAKLAFPLMAPKDWLFVVGGQGCDLQWSGIGVTMGVNEVAKNACPTSREKFDGSTFFSPFPGIDRAKAMDPEFAAALGNRADTAWDDIWVALWGTTKGMVELLRRTGPQLTRAKFVSTMESTTGLDTKLGPILSYSPTDHFGAEETHVLRANCNGKTAYDTADVFLKY